MTKDLSSTYEGYVGEYAQRWSGDNAGNRAILDERIVVATEMLGQRRHLAGRVLDLGGGVHGSFPGLFPNAHVINLDILLWRLQAGTEDSTIRARVCADGSHAPFADGTFDIVVLGTVLSSVDRSLADAILVEADRLLADGGALVVYDMRLPSPGNRSIRPVHRRQLRGALRGRSLEVRSLTVLPPLARRLGSRTGLLYPILARLPFVRSHLLAVIT